MGTRLIRLKDGTLVEVEDMEEEGRLISNTPTAMVEGSLSSIEDILQKICDPIARAWRNLESKVAMERAEIELRLSFEGKGNVFITQASAGAHLTMKLVFRPGESGDPKK